MDYANARTAVQALMARYTTSHLRSDIEVADFRSRINEYLRLTDHAMEKYVDPARQRDLSVHFHWGHNHDFGTFRLRGRMGDRHIRLISRYAQMGAIPLDLAGASVFDIGCWTGGTSLLFAAMGASVYAIEEVRKYAECASYLAYAFGVEDRLRAYPDNPPGWHLIACNQCLLPTHRTVSSYSDKLEAPPVPP